jgi:hypothetical protein
MFRNGIVRSCPAVPHVCHTMHALSVAPRHSRNHEKWSTLLENLDDEKDTVIPKSSGKEIAMMIQSLTKIDRRDTESLAPTMTPLLECLADHATRIGPFSMNEHSIAVTSLGLLKLGMAEKFLEAVCAHPPRLKYPQNVAQIVFAIGSCAGLSKELKSDAFSGWLGEAVKSTVYDFHVKDIVQVLQGFARASVRDDEVLNALDNRMTPQLQYMDNVSVSAILHAFSKLGCLTQNFPALLATSVQKRIDLRTVSAVLGAVPTHIDKSTARSLQVVVNEFPKMRDQIRSIHTIIGIIRNVQRIPNGVVDMDPVRKGVVESLTFSTPPDWITCASDSALASFMRECIRFSIPLESLSRWVVTHRLNRYVRVADSDQLGVLVRLASVVTDHRMSEFVFPEFVRSFGTVESCIRILQKIDESGSVLAKAVIDRLEELRWIDATGKQLAEAAVSIWRINGEIPQSLVHVFEAMKGEGDDLIREWVLGSDGVVILDPPRMLLFGQAEMELDIRQSGPPPPINLPPTDNDRIVQILRLIEEIDPVLYHAIQDDVLFVPIAGETPSRLEMARAMDTGKTTVVFVPSDRQVTIANVALLLRQLE